MIDLNQIILNLIRIELKFIHLYYINRITPNHLILRNTKIEIYLNIGASKKPSLL